ncbi:MAG: DUF333 domain-containing protein [Candidatus Pacebacteria bacterium]|nr:DUF333 domain-containing protein [Candidatus Paceibacterota bacterium]
MNWINWIKQINLVVWVVIGAAIILILGLRFLVGGPEDSWICSNGQWVKHGNPSVSQPTEQCANDEKVNLANPASVNCEEKGGELEIKNIEGGQIGICGFSDGTRCEEWAYFRGECKAGNKIIVYSPNINQEITSSPIELTGEARTWYFEGSFPVKLLDSANNVLASGFVTAQSDWMTTEFVPFKGTLKLQSFPKATSTGVLVFQKDNPSDMRELDEEYRMPVMLVPIETTKIKVFYNNSKMDPEISCNKVFAVEREVEKNPALANLALKELLSGPTSDEASRGFFTSINSGVHFKKLTIENGIAKVDFNEPLESPGGGSCRVSSIRAEITETLKQFPTVKGVIISINGRTEDILQP